MPAADENVTPFRYAGLRAAIRPLLRYPSSLRLVPGRGELPFVLNARRLLGTGAEIGVQEAGFSTHLLRHWRGRRLVSVDPWLEDAPTWRSVDNVSQPQQ